jgi:putative transcriptional regulator
VIPVHHLPPELLLATSAGRTDEATALVAAVHLTLCPTCRADLARLDAVGGALLEAAPAEATKVPDALWAKLDAAVPEPTPPAPAPSGKVLLPRPLVRYLGVADVDRLPWKRILPGADELHLPLDRNGTPVRMTRTRGGFVLPRHTHEGTEMTLVLAGGFTDGGEHFARGDLSVCGPSVTHTIHFDPGDPCVALVVNEGHLVPKSAWAKALSWFVDF